MALSIISIIVGGVFCIVGCLSLTQAFRSWQKMRQLRLQGGLEKSSRENHILEFTLLGSALLGLGVSIFLFHLGVMTL